MEWWGSHSGHKSLKSPSKKKKEQIKETLTRFFFIEFIGRGEWI